MSRPRSASVAGICATMLILSLRLKRFNFKKKFRRLPSPNTNIAQVPTTTAAPGSASQAAVALFLFATPFLLL